MSSGETDRPPVLPSDLHYEKWRTSINEWRKNTSVEPKRRALMVRAQFTGRAREVALKLDAADLNSRYGMDILLQALDKVLHRR